MTLIGSLEPTRAISPFSSTRSSLICVASGMSPTSSRNSVPPSAYSNLPLRSRSAPVNAPLTWPNSSLSRMFSLERRAVQRPRTACSPRAVLVDRLGHQLLAGAGLALDQHGGVGRGDLAEPVDRPCASAGCRRSRPRSRTARRAGVWSSTFARASRWVCAALSTTARSWPMSSGLGR